MKTVKRRRKENRTDYAKRLKLLKAETPRIAVRKTNKYIISQYITSRQTQDMVEITVNSKDLLEYGWPKNLNGSLKSLPAAYLTGFLMGRKILKEKKEIPIIDFGMMRALWGTRIFAVVKGLVDSGLEMKHDKKTFPDEERITGKHMKSNFSKNFIEIKSKISKI